MTSLDRVRLAGRIALHYVRARWLMATRPLPAAVDHLSQRKKTGGRPHTPEQLARGVAGVLRLGRRRLRCLPRALVLYALLVEQGQEPKLFVGLPGASSNPDAHAWVELDGTDVGPPPGRDGHESMVSYPLPAP